MAHENSNPPSSPDSAGSYHSPFRSAPAPSARRLAIPLVSGRYWDRKSSPHAGKGSALRVPVSEGPGNRILDRGQISQQALIAREPWVESSKLMETGVRYDRPKARGAASSEAKVESKSS